jgi:O-methyltransferase domain/Dimerisation domain
MATTDFPPDFPPQLVLQQLIQGFQVTQCIYVAAKLGIADLLKDGPRRSEELAQVTGTHAPSLYRVLRLLTAVDLLSEGEEHSFALTPLGTYLRTGVPGSMRATALNYGGEPTWQVWGALLSSVETGEPAYQQVFGCSNWAYRAQHPEAAALFDQTMTEWTASVAPTVASAYDFSSSARLVDVGGGHGQMLASILQAHPTLHAVLFDLPHVVQGASTLLAAAGVADRCEIIAGDAFTAVPAGYEMYLLSRVIHDWDDERAIALLTRCRQAMVPQGKVVLVERVILSGSTPPLLVLESDVNMLVATGGGKERTDVEYRLLLEAAGFGVSRRIAVLPPFYLIEAMRR